jgi:hypothetical protein
MTKLKSFSIAAAIAILASAVSVHAQPRDEANRTRRAVPEAAGACTVNKVSFSTMTGAETTSTTMVLLPGSRRSITTTARGCIIADFSGEVDAGVDRIFMRAVAVGEGDADPGVVRVGKNIQAGSFEARMVRFIFPSLPAGTYNIRLEWLSENGGSVRTNAHTVTVWYR